MNWNISAWAIRHPRPPILLFVALIVLGLLSFPRLPITREPNANLPLITVTIADPGVAPSELETQVTKPVEDAIAGVTSVKNITSTLTEGVSKTLVEFTFDVSTQTALDDVKTAVDRIRSDLPATAAAPVIDRINVAGAPIVTYAVTAPTMTMEQLSWFIDDTVTRKLLGLQGVAQVQRYGGVTREINVDLKPDRLEALGVTAGDINRALHAVNADMSSGSADFNGRNYSIRALGGALSVADIAALQIPLSDGRKVRLSDVATVTDAWADPVSFASVDNRTVVAFGVSRGRTDGDVGVGRRVAAAVAQLAATYPDVSFTRVDDTVTASAGDYAATMETLFEGAILAVIVVLLFLRNVRAMLISAVALPLSIMPTFWVLDMMGFSLNMISLLAITLAVGILVDDAIVEIENIVRHIRMGKSAYRAALDAADQIGLAVIAISVTIIAVFGPVSFMGGHVGEFFKEFGVTVAVAVFFSLLVARLITPMLAAYLLRGKGGGEQKPGPLMRAYLAVLGGTLRFRWLTLEAGVILFAAAIYGLTLLPSGFIPAEDVGRIVFSLELPPGSRLQDTRAATDEATRLMHQVAEVKSVFVIGGASPDGTAELRQATVIANLTPKSERNLPQSKIQTTLLDKMETIPDLRVYFANDRGARALAFGVMGTAGALVNEQARKIQREMAATGKFRAIASSAARDRPELIVDPDFEHMAELGISTATISEALRIATMGDIDVNLAKFTVGDRLIPIRVRLNDAARDNIAVIRQLPVPTPSGLTVPLSSVAKISFGQGPSQIERYDRERRVVIGADMAPGVALGEGLRIVAGLPAVNNMPNGTHVQLTGDAQNMGDAFATFSTAMVAGLLLVFVVLILLFRSVFQAFTILGSLPLAMGGVAAALWLTGSAVSLPVIIGILMLMGIVTKNAIMLVDFAIEGVKRGTPRTEAVIDACRKRARPIIMTTVAMSAGMAPASLALGDGGEFRAPMAIAVIGGLLVSTVLSLVFVPSLYTIMDDASAAVTRLFRRLFKPNEADDPAFGSAEGDAISRTHPQRGDTIPVAAE